jgi:hypothetical protein
MKGTHYNHGFGGFITSGVHGYAEKPVPVSGAPMDSNIVRQTSVLGPTPRSSAPVKDMTLRAGTRGRAFTAPEQAQIRAQRANSVSGPKTSPTQAVGQVASSISPVASAGAAMSSGAKSAAPRAVRRVRPVDPTLGRAPSGGGLNLSLGSVGGLRTSSEGGGASQDTPIFPPDRVSPSYEAEHGRRRSGGGDAGVDSGMDGGRSPSNDLGY